LSVPPVRGDVWWFDPRPTVGREQRATVRPCAIVSTNALNQGAAELVIVVPFTSRNRGISTHVLVAPPDGGLAVPSVAMCEQVRAISIKRLKRWSGRLAPETLWSIEDRLRILLQL
jgi:mRNA interferase MazF